MATKLKLYEVEVSKTIYVLAEDIRAVSNFDLESCADEDLGEWEIHRMPEITRLESVPKAERNCFPHLPDSSVDTPDITIEQFFAQRDKEVSDVDGQSK